MGDNVLVPSVQPEWARQLSIQQQSVLFLAARGPDGIAKPHPCKEIQRAYRGTVLVAAKYARLLQVGEHADSFMSLRSMASDSSWELAMGAFFENVDDLPHHFYMHLLHGAEILGYKHPDDVIGRYWWAFYYRGCQDLHLKPESEDEMDVRLGDWAREFWM